MNLTEDEQRVIEILTQHKPTPNAYGEPLQAVCEAMGWTEGDAEDFVYDLVGQKRLEVVSQGRCDTTRNLKAYWKKGPVLNA